MENKKIQDCSIVELKAILFDIEQEIKQKQNIMQQVGQLLQSKVDEEQGKPKSDVKVTSNNQTGGVTAGTVKKEVPKTEEVKENGTER